MPTDSSTRSAHAKPHNAADADGGWDIDLDALIVELDDEPVGASDRSGNRID